MPEDIWMWCKLKNFVRPTSLDSPRTLRGNRNKYVYHLDVVYCIPAGARVINKNTFCATECDGECKESKLW